MGISEIIGNKKDQILAIAEKYDAYHVRLFGSVAAGCADDQSDVDFLVDIEKGRTLLDLGGLLSDLKELLDRDVDVVTEAGLRPRIREDVLRQAVML